MTPTTAAPVAQVTDATFAAEVEQAPGLVLVDCTAAWCAPCRLVAPLLHEIAAERAGRVRVAALDADANPRTMVRFGVRSLPTLLLFRDGAVVARIVGAVPKGRIEAALAAHG